MKYRDILNPSLKAVHSSVKFCTIDTVFWNCMPSNIVEMCGKVSKQNSVAVFRKDYQVTQNRTEAYTVSATFLLLGSFTLRSTQYLCPFLYDQAESVQYVPSQSVK